MQEHDMMHSNRFAKDKLKYYSFNNGMSSKSSHFVVNQNQYFGRLKNCFNVNLSFRLINGNSSSAIMSFSLG